VLNLQQPGYLVDALPGIDARHSLALERKADVAAHVHVRVQCEQLEDEADVPMRGAPVGHVLPIEQNAARGG